MFFAIAPVPQTNFSHFYHLGPFVVSTDAGWQQHDTDDYSCIYKGYADSGRLFDLLDQIANQLEPNLFGNFCVIVYNNTTRQLQVKSDCWRSFPLYYEAHTITNLLPLAKTVWADSVVTVAADFSISETNVEIIGNIDDTSVTLEECIKFIDQRLTEKTQNFIKFNELPISNPI